MTDEQLEIPGTEDEFTLGDDDFAAGFKDEVLPKGKYHLEIIAAKPRIRVSKTNNRYLTVGAAPREDAAGNSVNGSLVYLMLPIEGKSKDGKMSRRQFIGFLSALGLEQPEVQSVYTSLMRSAPSIESIGDSKDTEVQLTLNGEPYSLEGRSFMASLKIDKYEDKESNKASTLWRAKEPLKNPSTGFPTE